jgi:AbrB family looped-hinge helix DNA binding protein
MALGRVLSRGQVTLPSAVREAAGVKPGDMVFVEAKGQGIIEIRVLPRLTLAELLERYTIDEPIDMSTAREEWEKATAQEFTRKLNH